MKPLKIHYLSLTIEYRMYLKFLQKLRCLGWFKTSQALWSAVQKTRLNTSKDNFIAKSSRLFLQKGSLPRSRFWMSRNAPSKERLLLGERCVTSKKRLRGRLAKRKLSILLNFLFPFVSFYPRIFNLEMQNFRPLRDERAPAILLMDVSPLMWLTIWLL